MRKKIKRALAACGVLLLCLAIGYLIFTGGRFVEQEAAESEERHEAAEVALLGCDDLSHGGAVTMWEMVVC